MGAEGLQGNLATLGLRWTLKKCEDLIEGYFATFPNVKLYMADLHAHARRHGYVVAMAGRRRCTPLVRSPNKSLVAGALREAGNFPIQGGAQVVIKKAMGELVPIYREWRGMEYEWNPLLQIHDDLVNEIQEDVVETILPIIVYIMENAVRLSVPLRVDAKMGKRWGSMEKWPPKEEK
jgi:DNA polymerase-1